MSKFLAGNIYLLLAILCASGGQIVFKALLNETGPLRFNWSFVQGLCSDGRLFRVLVVIAMLIAGFLFWTLSLSNLNISYAYSVGCSSVLLVTFFSVLFLNEPVSARMWWGAVLIVLGTILLVPSR